MGDDASTPLDRPSDFGLAERFWSESTLSIDGQALDSQGESGPIRTQPLTEAQLLRRRRFQRLVSRTVSGLAAFALLAVVAHWARQSSAKSPPFARSGAGSEASLRATPRTDSESAKPNEHTALAQSASAPSEPAWLLFAKAPVATQTALEDWSRSLRGLTPEELSRADQATSHACTKGDPKQREVACVAYALVLRAKGRTLPARRLLFALSTHAQSQAVRRVARDALRPG